MPTFLTEMDWLKLKIALRKKPKDFKHYLQIIDIMFQLLIYHSFCT